MPMIRHRAPHSESQARALAEIVSRLFTVDSTMQDLPPMAPYRVAMHIGGDDLRVVREKHHRIHSAYYRSVALAVKQPCELS